MKKILLVCNAGMSTSLLVQKMQNEAKGRGLDVEIEALPMENLDTADILLLGPQIGYAKGDFEKAVSDGTPVEVIAMADYGRMNAPKILDAALAQI